MKYKRSAEAREDFSKEGTITDYKGRERFEKIILHLIFRERERRDPESEKKENIVSFLATDEETRQRFKTYFSVLSHSISIVL